MFLGITLKSNGNLSHSTTDLAKKAKKALFCIKSYTTLVVYMWLQSHICRGEAIGSDRVSMRNRK